MMTVASCDNCGSALGYLDGAAFVACESCGTMCDVTAYFDDVDDVDDEDDVDDVEQATTQDSRTVVAGKHDNDVMRCIKRFNRYSEVVSNRERMLIRAYEDIDSVSNAMRLSESITRDAKRRFDEITSRPEFKKKRRSALAVATIFLSARRDGFACSVDQISRILGVKTRLAYRMIDTILSNSCSCPDLVSAAELVPSICTKLCADRTVQDRAIALIDKLTCVAEDCSFKPSSVAASVIFLCVDVRKHNRQRILQASGISATTLTKCCRHLMDVIAERDKYLDLVIESNKSIPTPDPCCGNVSSTPVRV